MAKLIKGFVKFTNHRKATYFYSGLGLILTSVILLLTHPLIFTSVLKYMLRFEPDSDVFVNWVTNKEPCITDFYLFNWTNPENIHDPNIKPNFNEVGPYRFHTIVDKINVTFNDNGTTTYSIIKNYRFIKEENTRELTDMITTINPIPNVLAFRLRHWSYWPKVMASLAFNAAGLKLSTTRSVDELMFKGFHDPILDTMSKIPFINEGLNKFGYFYKKNYTDHVYGPLNVKTDLLDDHGKIQSYMYKNNSGFFEQPCDEFRGNMGEMSPLFRDKNKDLTMFIYELSSHVVLQYKNEQNIKGIDGIRYEPNVMFDNGYVFPENECFCNGECVEQGVLNFSSISDNTPYFVSMPHFYLADSSYRDIIDGMRPDKRFHTPYAIYEPTSGVPLALGQQMQLNMLLQPVEKIMLFSSVPRIFVPIFHMNQTFEIYDDVVNRIKLIQNSPKINKIVSSVLFLLGLTLIIVSLIVKDGDSKKNRGREKENAELKVISR